MNHFQASLSLLEFLLHTLSHCTVLASDFYLEGDYLIGGLFDVHRVNTYSYHYRPEAVDCSRQPLILSSYRRFQLMRFTVEEINNSSSLLPNVSLGYKIFDHCSNVENFPGIFSLISVDNLIQPWKEPNSNLSTMPKVIATVGPFSSADTLTAAPLFMADLTPLISYGAGSSIFSNKETFPSFLRTAHPNRNAIQLIIGVLQHFSWHWVAFLSSDDAYGEDGLELFIKMIQNTDICLGYRKGLNHKAPYSQIFKQIEAQQIHVIIVFAPEWTAEPLIQSAMEQNVTEKVWIAGDAWSLNTRLRKEERIRNIGTVLGFTEPEVNIPWFNEFILSTMCKSQSRNDRHTFCNQFYKCSDLSLDEISAADWSYNFPVYTAIYAIAHALHNILQCGTGRCNSNITVDHHMASSHDKYYEISKIFLAVLINVPVFILNCNNKLNVVCPHQVLTELLKSNFTLLNQTIQFDEKGDPRFGSFSIIFWNHSGDAEEIGLYEFHPTVNFTINSSRIQWYTNGEVPSSLCSKECHPGYAKKQDTLYKCCFVCEICPKGTYLNITEDPYTCVACKETEWSTVGSTSCKLRSVEYIPFTDTGAIVIMVAAGAFVGLILAMSVLFAINFNTPVVRSAGGPMCFLILGCLCLCTISVFFYFGKPTTAFCILRFLPFYLFYTPCLACFVVRSFQIVCIFKIAAKFPKLHTWWLKYNGQWIVINLAFFSQVFFLLIGYSANPPNCYNETVYFHDKIVLGCDFNLGGSSAPVFLLLVLCFLCFVFSYMGKDLPKNYNEAKAITFCLLLLILTWTIFATVSILYRGKFISSLNALAILSSLYCFLLWYFLPKCYIIIFHPEKNTQQYFKGLIQDYTKTISQ